MQKQKGSGISRTAGVVLGALLPILLVGQNLRAQPASNSTVVGATIFSQYCSRCHGPRGEGISAVITIAGPCIQAEHDVHAVMEVVRSGRGQMPTYGRLLQPQQIQDVAEFVTQHIAVIPMSGGNLSQGGTLFRVYCASCHRTAVRGGALAFVGTNAPALTGKSAALVAGAIRWGPGPMPEFPASVLGDRQVTSIAEYVAYVERPPSPGGATLEWYGPVPEGFVAWLAILGLVVISVLIELGGKG